jgi:hypothetical protein
MRIGKEAWAPDPYCSGEVVVLRPREVELLQLEGEQAALADNGVIEQHDIEQLPGRHDLHREGYIGRRGVGSPDGGLRMATRAMSCWPSGDGGPQRSRRGSRDRRQQSTSVPAATPAADHRGSRSTPGCCSTTFTQAPWLARKGVICAASSAARAGVIRCETHLDTSQERLRWEIKPDDERSQSCRPSQSRLWVVSVSRPSRAPGV